MGFLKRFFGSGKVRETEEKSQERLHQQTLRDLGIVLLPANLDSQGLVF
jgi:hypothetical protein